MGIAARLKDAWGALTRATTAQVVDATLPPYSNPFAQRTDIQGMFDRAFSVVGIAAKFNAQGCADVPVRLYRKGKGKISRARREWLRSTRANAGPTLRSALYAQSAEDFVEVKDHPILDLLANPNTYETGTEYIRKHFLTLEICGNAFHALDVGSRTDEPVAMNQLMPQYVRALPPAKGTGELVGGWEYGRNQADRLTFKPEEVVQCRMYPAYSDAVWGTGPLHDVWKEFDLLAYALQFETALMQNESRPSYVAEFGPTVTQEQASAAIASIEKKLRGAAKAGGILGGVRDAVLKPLGLTAKEMQYREGQAVVEKRILKAYGIPESLLARNEGSISIGGAGASVAARSVWLSLTILPRVNAWADTLNTHLLPRFGLRAGEYWFAPDNPDSDDDAVVAEIHTKLAAAGVETLNEARTELGLEQYPPEIGDVARINGVSVSALDTRATMDPFGAFVADDAGDKHEPKEGPKPEPEKRRVKRAKKEPEPANLPEETDVKKLGTAVKKWLAASTQAVAEAVNMSGSIQITLDPIATSFEKLVQPTITQTFGKGWGGGAAQVNKIKAAAVPAFDVVNEWAVNYAMNTKTVLSQSVAETLIENGKKAALDTINETIAKGIQGMTLPELQKAVKAKLGDISDAKARTIALTESHKAYEYGTQAAWKESGLVKSRRWSLSVDPCPLCVEQAQVNGNVSIGEPYEFGGMVPAELHPNCRCTEVVAEYHDEAANLALQESRPGWENA